MFHTVLIANRGEIAVRIARTLKRLGIRSVAVHSDADRNAMHVALADAAVSLGGNSAAESYLKGDRIIQAALDTGAEAVIPGYGFLSENTAFADACSRAGLTFVGPTPDQIRRFGLKHEARALARAAGVPLVPGTELLGSLAEAEAAAETLGYPIMLKSTAGGGGIGLTRCDSSSELATVFEKVQALSQRFFNDGSVFLERYVQEARHVEVQIFGDGRGRVVALGERDCSIQRRHQKVLEETPAPRLSAATRQRLLAAAVRLGESVGYSNAGTVEFIHDGARDEFYFLEVNTRLQVEHPITEEVTGVDLVEWMLRTAAGEPPDLANLHIEPVGASIEVRLYAEDPIRSFQPCSGWLTEVTFPDDVRVDGWVSTGTEVSSHYDPLLAKLIVRGADRSEAIAKLSSALARTRLSGIATNLEYLRQVVGSDAFRAGQVSTRFLDSFSFDPPAIEVIEPGTYTTVQDYPGRIGHWDVGVPPSGPMDDYAFRVANRIVGNHPSAAGLESTLLGPTLRFHRAAVVALTGAPAPATLDGDPVAWWQPIAVEPGQVLRVGTATSGCRSYLALRNGFDVPVYLGAKSTFALGQFGGHAGRPLRPGDVLTINDPSLPGSPTPAPETDPAPAPPAMIPIYPSRWEVGVLYGPHGAPDFFTEDSIAGFFSTEWRVHYNSNRLGVRLSGPPPRWARTDGGEAGLHPSNVHDCEYAIGSVNFTGDMPVILTCDGPSLGGFVCPVTVAKAELWKIGQVKPGDRIVFRRIEFDEARERERAMDASIVTMPRVDPEPAPTAKAVSSSAAASPCVLVDVPASGSRPAVAYRQAGDKYVLIEYGPMTLDLRLRFRVHALMEALERNPISGVLELSPGVRSLQVQYDSRVTGQRNLLEELMAREKDLPSADEIRVPTRVLRMPMAWQDSATLDAVARYRRSVRDQAPWLPSNVEFMRRINGLDSVDDVREIVFSASYMVLGLGDVYLGAPCAVPVDPRHRLLTSKYNPARTFTAEGTVGIGGVYMCIYGMDSPGGYQLVGRTLPIWNKFLKNPVFTGGEPWLLKFFDQVRFYEVAESELTERREAFREGRLSIDISEGSFDHGEHERFLTEHAPDIAAFRARQRDAFEREVAHWRGDTSTIATETDASPTTSREETGGHIVSADISGNIWKVLVAAGMPVRSGDPVVVIEAMKMEIVIRATVAGTVAAVRCRQGRLVTAGDPLLVIVADG